MTSRSLLASAQTLSIHVEFRQRRTFPTKAACARWSGSWPALDSAVENGTFKAGAGRGLVSAPKSGVGAEGGDLCRETGPSVRPTAQGSCGIVSRGTLPLRHRSAPYGSGCWSFCSIGSLLTIALGQHHNSGIFDAALHRRRMDRPLKQAEARGWNSCMAF